MRSLSCSFRAISAALLGLLLASNAQSETPLIDCNLKTLENFCETVKAKEKTQLRSSIPYKFSNGQSMPSVDSISGESIEMSEDGSTPKIPWGKMQRLQKLFKVTQAYAQEAVLQGRRLEDLSDEERNFITRIKMMKLSDLSKSIERDTCHKNYRFGFNPSTHTLIMCPEMAGYPDSGIIWSMAAFIGRGLGTCGAGVVKFVDAKKNVLFDRIPESRHPFNGLRSCLIKGGFPDAQGTLDFSKPELKAALENEITVSNSQKNPELPVLMAKTADALKNEKNLAWGKKAISDFRECLPEHTGSRVDSGIQDWFGSEVAARYLEDHPLNAEKPEDALQPLSPMVDYLCRTPTADELTRKFHAPVQTRFDSAIFANARLRKVMNCNPKTTPQPTCNLGLANGETGSLQQPTAAPADTAR